MAVDLGALVRVKDCQFDWNWLWGIKFPFFEISFLNNQLIFAAGENSANQIVLFTRPHDTPVHLKIGTPAANAALPWHDLSEKILSIQSGGGIATPDNISCSPMPDEPCTGWRSYFSDWTRMMAFYYSPTYQEIPIFNFSNFFLGGYPVPPYYGAVSQRAIIRINREDGFFTIIKSKPAVEIVDVFFNEGSFKVIGIEYMNATPSIIDTIDPFA